MASEREIDQLIERVARVTNGFGDIRLAADEVASSRSAADSITVAHRLFGSDVHQARILATFIFGRFAAQDADCLAFLRWSVSRDADWRVQEILAQAFDYVCQTVGYEPALPLIEDWLADGHPNVRRAVSEGLRIWTTRPYFKEHPEVAVELLSRRKADDSEYVRKSVGNAIRDISRKHASLVRAETDQWDTSDKRVAQTHKLASKFLE